ncbi:peptidase [Streptomyces sp. NPDC047000]|uniref:peptidase n=1 Tax=Streptomyces sp. NPDC047000 TaxID=3155474 RepID=UPI0033FCED8D
MQPRIPRQSADDRSVRRPEDDARLSAELAAVVAGARRRALRDGDRHIDTAHLLHTLLESDPAVRAVFGDGPRTVRLLGYLVQRSIGYGLRWQGVAEDSGPLPVPPPGGGAGVRRGGVSLGKESEGLSPLAGGALEHACVLAARRGGDLVRGTDLLAAIVADPLARAVEVLAHAGIDAGGLAVLLRPEVRGERPGAEGVEPGAVEPGVAGRLGGVGSRTEGPDH